MKVNPISGKREALPRIMWADVDPEYVGATAVSIYGTKADQRGNRPDLKPVPVVVIELRDLTAMHTDLINAVLAAREKGLLPRKGK